MNSDHSPLLELIRSELWQTPPRIDPSEPCPDWNEIFLQARRQTVVGMLANAVTRLTDDRLLPPLPLAARLMAEAENIRHTFRRHSLTQQSLLNEMAARRLKPIVIKGLTCAAFYPEPAVRQSGDIDLFLPPSDSEALSQFLRDRSISPTPHADGSLSFIWQGIEVEIHPRLLDIHSPRAIRRIEALGLGADSPEITLLLLAAHIFKHAIGHGVGLRQLCDLAMATSRLHPLIDPERMRLLSCAAGLSRWMPKVYSLLVNDLHLPESLLPYPMPVSRRRARRLRKIIFRGGNFGLHEAGRHSRRGPAATALAFLRRAGFSLSTAPAETFHTVITLARGRL